MAEILDTRKFNEDARESGKKYLEILLKNQYALSIDENGYLEASTRMHVGYQFGLASKISYTFLRYGVFVDKGVGKGYPIETVRGNAAIAKGGGKGRTPKMWYSLALEKQAQELADILQQDLADIAVNSIRIR